MALAVVEFAKRAHGKVESYVFRSDAGCFASGASEEICPGQRRKRAVEGLACAERKQEDYLTGDHFEKSGEETLARDGDLKGHVSKLFFKEQP
jgi:hypothetical protein